MSPKATPRQKQFLRVLGHKNVANLSVEDASQLISKLLAEEKASGKSFPCPYCKGRFAPRPKHSKKCPHCGRKIIHMSGHFFTDDAAERKYQRDWYAEMRADAKEQARIAWQDEKAWRRDAQDMTMDEVDYQGFKIVVGKDCSVDADYIGKIILLEDAYDAPEVLPPFKSCHHETCGCEYSLVRAKALGPNDKIAHFTDPEVVKKLKTRAGSPQSIDRFLENDSEFDGTSGCCVLLASVAAILLIALRLR